MDKNSNASVPLPPSPSVPKCLLERLTGCQVLTYLIESGSKNGDNFMGILYSISAEVIPPNESSKQTRHYILKCYPKHPARQVYLSKTNIFFKELQFYQVWAKELVQFQTEVVGNSFDEVIKPAFPPCIGGEAVDFSNPLASVTKVYKPIENCILMTDLKKTFGYRMVDKSVGLDLDHMLLVVHELATMHALCWAYKKKKVWELMETYPFLNCTFTQEDKQVWTNVCSKNVEMSAAAIDAELGKGNGLSKHLIEANKLVEKIVTYFLEMKDDSEEVLWAMQRDPPREMVEATKNEEPWRVICHGDAWTNNLLFKYDSNGKPDHAMLIDFQLIKNACPTSDLVYVCYTSFSPKNRKAHLDTIFQTYHDRFVQVCSTLKTEPLPGFSVESIKRRYNCLKLFGFLTALVMIPIASNDRDSQIDMEQLDESASVDDMFNDAMSEGASGALYTQRVIEVTEELIREGVI